MYSGFASSADGAGGGAVLLSQSLQNVGSNQSRVTISIQHGVQLPWKELGFRVQVNHWSPDGRILLYAIGPDGERIALASEQNLMNADHTGSIAVDISYRRRGLRSGHWLIVVVGDPGTHIIETDLP